MTSISGDFHPQTQKNQNPENEEADKEQTEESNKEEEQQEQGQEEERARCEWDFTLSTVISSSSVGPVSDALGTAEFDPSDNLLATGGIARKIRIYSVKSLLPHEGSHGDELYNIAFLDNTTACEYTICTPAKLSSLRWRPNSGGRVLGSADYDGVVMEYDLELRMPVFERDEHSGRRVWSLDYSHSDPVIGASGSDDGTMQMWDPRCDEGQCVATVQPGASGNSVCCVEFDPFGRSLVVAGSADRKAYGYDIRRMADPILVFDSHCKPVAYVRFLDDRRMMTAGTDGCLKQWDINDSSVIRTYRGHMNTRNFVGLSVWRNGGLVGCGSESNQVFVYDKRWGEPIWVHGSAPVAQPGSARGFVSSVCWRQAGEDQCTLVAGGSNGVLQVFVGKRRSITEGDFSYPPI